VQTASTKEVSKQLHSNPHAEICGYVGGKWMRLSAEMVLDDRREARAAMLEAYSNLRNRGYDEDDGITEIWYLKNATARIYVFNDLTETITF